VSGPATWAGLVARVASLVTVLALPLFAGYLFTDRILWAGLLAMICVVAAEIAAAFGARGIGAGLGAAGWPLAAFVAWNIVAAVFGVYVHASLVALLGLVSCLAVLALFASLFQDRSWRRRGWMVVVVAGVIEGIIGLRDWTQTLIAQGDASWRIFGTMFNPNVLAGYLLAVIPAAVVVLVWTWHGAAQEQERPRLGLIGAGFAVIIVCSALLLTGSRAGLLGALLGAGVMGLLVPTRISRRWIVAAAIGLVVLMALAPPVRTRLLSATTQSNSAIFRWYTWKGTVHMIAARPLLGFGPGCFEHAYPRYALVGFTRMAHQTPLQIAAEAGVPALLFAAAGVMLIGRALVRTARAGGSAGLEAAAGLGALAAVGLQNMADYTWYVPAVGMTLSATVGLGLAAGRAAEGAGGVAGAAPTRRRLHWIPVVLGLVVIVGCIVGLRAQALANRGRALMAQGRYSIATGWLRRATQVDPLDADIWEDLGQAAAGAGRIGSAVQARLRAAELNPNKAGNYLALAHLYDALGDGRSALRAAEQAVTVHPNWPRAYVVLAQLQAEQGMMEKALRTWRALERVYQSPVGRYQAIEEVTDFSYAYAWLALGREAERAGDVTTAADYYQRAADLAGEFARIRRQREEALRLLGRFDEAEVEEAERMRDEALRALERLSGEREERDER